jgi:class 3 adenylate cyclase/pimeloyl-ACP methyl ester carboxylesterase
MMSEPPTKYALTKEGVCVAYKALGVGPRALIFSPGWVTNLEILWEWPACARFFERLARRCRLVVYDKQGTGLSDRVATFPTLEARMDDIDAVMTANGMEGATLFGPTQGAALSALFAATFPERVDALVTYGAFARVASAPDWPYGGESEGEWEEHILEGWGTPSWTRDFAVDWGAEGLRDDPAFIAWLARLMRFSATPTAAVAFGRAWDETDVREILPSVGAPTLLLSRGADDPERAEIEHTASMLPISRVVELPHDHWSPYVGDPGPLVDAIESFLDGVGEADAILDRALATVLFTDIVDSTRRASEVGDKAWRGLVELHHRAIRAQLARYRGVEVDTAGDGFFATFDGPARAVRCGQACVLAAGSLGIEIRVGIHTGEVETIDRKAGGIAVNIGARVGSMASPSEVLVSQTVKDLVAGSGLAFEDAGEHELKGIPDRWHVYRVSGLAAG